MALQVEFTFDDKSYRHYMNGHETVLHCHHYMTLTTKLAEKWAEQGGTRILREVAEDSMRPLFDDTIRKHQVASADERLEVGKEYYAVMGMGRLEVTGTESGGEVRMSHSHIDEGWIQKWGQHDKAVNHFTCGYAAAMFAAAFDKPPRSYEVSETSSIVKGDAESVLTVSLKSA